MARVRPSSVQTPRYYYSTALWYPALMALPLSPATSTISKLSRYNSCGVESRFMAGQRAPIYETPWKLNTRGDEKFVGWSRATINRKVIDRFIDLVWSSVGTGGFQSVNFVARMLQIRLRGLCSGRYLLLIYVKGYNIEETVSGVSNWKRWSHFWLRCVVKCSYDSKIVILYTYVSNTTFSSF